MRVQGQLLTWLNVVYEQDLLRNTSFFLRSLQKMGTINRKQTPACAGEKNAVPLSDCPTFLARIRATRREISDGHQFSLNAIMAEHSSLCMAQSPFYTQTHNPRGKRSAAVVKEINSERQYEVRFTFTRIVTVLLPLPESPTWHFALQ